MISGHGNNIYQYDRDEIVADFSSNIAFNNSSSKILSFLGDNMSSLCNYPDPLAARLTRSIADYHGVSADSVVVANGSTEAFYLLAHYLQRSNGGRCRTAIATPSFAEYEDSCKLYQHEISYFELSLLDMVDLAEYDSLWICSPNNPDGRRTSITDIYKLAAKNRKCRIILDRAYNELSSDSEAVEDLPENVILVDSFTKFYGIPGLRLGYIVASEGVIAELREICQPWSVNSLSLLAGEYILNNLESLQIDIEELIGESHYTQSEISKIDGYRVTPSNCNFFLVEITNGRSAAELYDYLLGSHKLLIRNCSNFRSLSPNHFRVAAQQRSFNDKLIAALREWR